MCTSTKPQLSHSEFSQGSVRESDREKKIAQEVKLERQRQSECQMQLCFETTVSRRECVGAPVTSAADRCALCRGEMHMKLAVRECLCVRERL